MVTVNGTPITPEERDFKSKMEYVWNIDETLEDAPELKVTGWIGTFIEPLEEDDRGVVVMASGKLVQEPTFFEVTGGQQYAASLHGLG